MSPNTRAKNTNAAIPKDVQLHPTQTTDRQARCMAKKGVTRGQSIRGWATSKFGMKLSDVSEQTNVERFSAGALTTK